MPDLNFKLLASNLVPTSWIEWKRVWMWVLGLYVAVELAHLARVLGLVNGEGPLSMMSASGGGGGGGGSITKEENATTAAAATVKATNLYNTEEDVLYRSNLERIRPRPRHLRLVFVGDSLTRYQYLSLAYFLKFGTWWNPQQAVTDANNNLLFSHSYHHVLHPDQDWNEFFYQSNRMLYPNEVCDCQRRQSSYGSYNNSNNIVKERRYFHDPLLNNTLVYIHLNGNETTAPHRGYFGSLDPKQIFTNWTQTVQEFPPERIFANVDQGQVAWEYDSWRDVLQYHVAELRMASSSRLHTAPTDGMNGITRNDTVASPSDGDDDDAGTLLFYVILNAGLHPHNLHPNDFAQLPNSLQLVWKTTTYPLQWRVELQVQQQPQNSNNNNSYYMSSFAQHRHNESQRHNNSSIHNHTNTIPFPVQQIIKVDEEDDNSNNNMTETRRRRAGAHARARAMIDAVDAQMCRALHHCFNLSWTCRLRQDLFADNYHYLEPVYRIMNEQLLQQLQLLGRPHNDVFSSSSSSSSSSTSSSTASDSYSYGELLDLSVVVNEF